MKVFNTILYLETFSEIYNKDLVIVTPDSHPDKLSIEAFQYLEKNAKKYFSSLASLARRGLALVLSLGGARPPEAVARENSLSHRLALAL